MTSTPRHKPTLTAVLGLAVVLVMALALSACGGSDETGDDGAAADTAVFADVCTAAEQVSAKIELFRDYDPDLPAGVAQVPNYLDDVRVAMAEVDEEIAKLEPEDRQKAEAAAREFTLVFVDSGFALSKTMSGAAGESDAAEQIKAASTDVADELEKAYETAYSSLGCS